MMRLHNHHPSSSLSPFFFFLVTILLLLSYHSPRNFLVHPDHHLKLHLNHHNLSFHLSSSSLCLFLEEQSSSFLVGKNRLLSLPVSQHLLKQKNEQTHLLLFPLLTFHQEAPKYNTQNCCKSFSFFLHSHSVTFYLHGITFHDIFLQLRFHE